MFNQIYSKRRTKPFYPGAPVRLRLTVRKEARAAACPKYWSKSVSALVLGCSPPGTQFSEFFRIFPEHVDPLACEGCNHTEIFNRRPDGRKPLGEFKSKLHIGLYYFQQLCLVGLDVCRG